MNGPAKITAADYPLIAEALRDEAYAFETLAATYAEIRPTWRSSTIEQCLAKARRCSVLADTFEGMAAAVETIEGAASHEQH